MAVLKPQVFLARVCVFVCAFVCACVRALARVCVCARAPCLCARVRVSVCVNTKRVGILTANTQRENGVVSYLKSQGCHLIYPFLYNRSFFLVPSQSSCLILSGHFSAVVPFSSNFLVKI